MVFCFSLFFAGAKFGESVQPTCLTLFSFFVHPGSRYVRACAWSFGDGHACGHLPSPPCLGRPVRRGAGRRPRRARGARRVARGEQSSFFFFSRSSGLPPGPTPRLARCLAHSPRPAHIPTHAHIHHALLFPGPPSPFSHTELNFLFDASALPTPSLSFAFLHHHHHLTENTMLIPKKNRRDVYKHLFKGAWRGGRLWAPIGGGARAAAAAAATAIGGSFLFCSRRRARAHHPHHPTTQTHTHRGRPVCREGLHPG